MKLMVIGSNGKAAKEIIKEAKSRGLEVVGVARSANQNEGIEFIQKDLFDLTKEDLANVDVVLMHLVLGRLKLCHFIQNH